MKEFDMFKERKEVSVTGAQTAKARMIRMKARDR